MARFAEQEDQQLGIFRPDAEIARAVDEVIVAVGQAEAALGIIDRIAGAVLGVGADADFERRRLPNRLTYPAAIAAVAICWAWPDRSVTDIAIGAGLGTAAAALLVVLRFGGGDSKLVILIGFPYPSASESCTSCGVLL